MAICVSRSLGPISDLEIDVVGHRFRLGRFLRRYSGQLVDYCQGTRVECCPVKCSAGACDRPQHAKSYCDTHYRQWRRYKTAPDGRIFEPWEIWKGKSALKRDWINAKKQQPKPKQWFIAVRVSRGKNFETGEPTTITVLQSGYPGAPLADDATFWMPIPDPTWLPVPEKQETA